MESGNTLVYDQVQGDGTFTDLVRLIQAFNVTDDKLEHSVAKIVDLDMVAKCFAFTFASGMGDNMYSSANNYILYYNPHRELFEVYIMDFEYFESYEYKIEYLMGNIYDPPMLNKPNEWRRLMKIDSFKAKLTYYVKVMVDKIMSSQTVQDRIAKMGELLNDFVAMDRMYYSRTDRAQGKFMHATKLLGADINIRNLYTRFQLANSEQYFTKKQ